MSTKLVKLVTCDICGTEWQTDKEDTCSRGVLVALEGGNRTTMYLDLCRDCLDKATVISEVVVREPTGHTLPPDFYEPEMREVGRGYAWRTI